jgi:hypothetical protein
MLALLLEDSAGLWSRPSLLIQAGLDLKADKVDRCREVLSVNSKIEPIKLQNHGLIILYSIIGYACKQRIDQKSIFLAFVMEVD